jgi:hypothetical protein
VVDEIVKRTNNDVQFGKGKCLEKARRICIVAIGKIPSFCLFLFTQHTNYSLIKNPMLKHVKVHSLREKEGEIGIYNSFRGTCYMLSVIQQLYRCKLFRYTILGYNHTQEGRGVFSLEKKGDKTEEEEEKNSEEMIYPIYLKMRKTNELVNEYGKLWDAFVDITISFLFFLLSFLFIIFIIY